MTYLKTNKLGNFGVGLLCNSVSQSNRSQPPGLSNGDFAKSLVIFLYKKLPDLCAFSGSSLATNKSDQMVIYCFYYFLLFHENGQLLTKLVYFFRPVKFEISSRNLQVGVSNVFECIGLVLVFRKLNLFFLFNDFQGLFSKSLKIQISSHQLFRLINQFRLAIGLIDNQFVIQHRLNPRLISINSENIYFWCLNSNFLWLLNNIFLCFFLGFELLFLLVFFYLFFVQAHIHARFVLRLRILGIMLLHQ